MPNTLRKVKVSDTTIPKREMRWIDFIESS
jgi:hypothetical protein